MAEKTIANSIPIINYGYLNNDRVQAALSKSQPQKEDILKMRVTAIFSVHST
ncbi:hypothetical protein CRD_02160 [Raphidiopsis brookii D9]|nr:hypothetical protein CRD_02160 [Raphidiopsis brookii D9]